MIIWNKFIKFFEKDFIVHSHDYRLYQVEFQTNECVSDQKETINRSIQNRVQLLEPSTTTTVLDFVSIC